MASAAKNIANAYGLASCPKRETLGITAKTSPLASPARRPPSRRPMRATIAAAAAIAITDGRRMAVADWPNTAIHRCSPR
jgi:hypothetical protein